MSRTIFVDADSCKRKIQDYLLRFVLRESNEDVMLVLVSDRFFIGLPEHARIMQVQVPRAEDSADKYILDYVKKEDLVLTKDLSLIEKLLARNIAVINDLAEQYDKDSISARKRRAALNAELRTFSRTEQSASPGASASAKQKEEQKQFLRFVQYLNDWKQEEMRKRG